MPKHGYKAAAVPFVNDKGERSMKRVKVERYVAGKKPAYAKDEEEDDSSSYVSEDLEDPTTDEERSDDEGEEPENESIRFDQKIVPKDEIKNDPQVEDSDEDDDPRFRKMKQIESKIHKVQHIVAKQETPANRNTVIIEDEDDDEEDIRRRHALARQRQLDEPLGPQAFFSGDNKRDSSSGARDVKFGPSDDEDDLDEDDLIRRQRAEQNKRLDTDDLLKDFKLTGLGSLLSDDSAPIKTDEECEVEKKKLKDALEQAKHEAKFAQQLNRKIEEDIRREQEREARAKGDIAAREMSSVKTDDEDEELAYEEWKLREIKRVQRDKSERMLVSRKHLTRVL